MQFETIYDVRWTWIHRSINSTFLHPRKHWKHSSRDWRGHADVDKSPSATSPTIPRRCFLTSSSRIRLDAVSSLDNGSNKKCPCTAFNAGEARAVGTGNDGKSSYDYDLTGHHQMLKQKPMMRIPMLIPQKRYPGNQYGGYADSKRRGGWHKSRCSGSSLRSCQFYSSPSRPAQI